eukprot:TRINITY_DN6409_c0_g1_i1.p1 TRINITY_DN6409_c0_g1~~TRINITY_DN6409_c0_g1_i1.p1  ORF type:complete len:622 (-),score=94.35 TRINITY_DN6409_c0_g1_i1:69-1673(-)
MAGAGTSGRLSFFCARALSVVAKSFGSRVEFDYLMAGSDLALMKSQEAAEDDVVLSVQDLKRRTDGYDHVVYIGITCGLSAPYVGSQIDWILNSPESGDRFVSVLMGFNDASVARKVKVEKWNKTMFDVVSQLASCVGSGRHFILNPIVGPEPLTGSSRMKGGTITKILIEVLFGYIFHVSFPSVAIAVPDTNNSSNVLDFAAFFLEFERANRFTYLEEDALAGMIDHAGEALKNNAHVYYFAEDSIGILGLIDASECPPTFGADFTDMRGFVVGGWDTMRNVEGDLTERTSDPHYRIGAEQFSEEIAPTLTSKDVLLFIHTEGQRTDRLIEIARKTVTTSKNGALQFAVIAWNLRKPSGLADQSVLSAFVQTLQTLSTNPVKTSSVSIPNFNLLPGLPALLEISVKWVLNAVSLGAHILKGKVFRNRMIDLCLSNNKLYHRGCQMVSDIARIPLEAATSALLRAIFNVDIVTQEIQNYPVSKYNEVALKRKQVIPLAILLGCGRFATVAEAQAALDSEPVVRTLVERVLSDNK